MLDVHLVKHFGMLVNILALRGTKGNPQPITVKMVDGDEKYRLQYGGIIEEFKKVRRTKNPDGTTLSEIRASSTEEMLSLMADIRKSMKEVLHEEIVKAPNPDDYAAGSMMEMHLSTGDDIVQRAIVRIAINFLAFKERPRQAIEEICKYALGQVSGYVVNPYFPDNPAWEKLPEKVIAHSIQLRAFKEHSLFIAIVELFNVYRYYVVLDRFYIGPDITDSYSFDVIARKAIDRPSTFQIKSREEFLNHRIDPNDIIRKVLTEGTNFLNLVGYHRLLPHLGKLYPINGIDQPEREEITLDNIDRLAPLLHKSLGSPKISIFR